ncbi:uncharacterized protein LOC125942176 [Dermacentor silvarum]|uniref:uncharacterized protein LOC125942176 n=1 Tax=Dermacentor silvarum TaxID=543639 RepID=UPI00210134F6|nr:uncharacterized protein LOC125942176 [Dermacentor silvarum]
MGEVSSMPSSFTMEHFLLANRDLLDKDEERAWIICARHRWRDECDLLTPMGVKDTLPHCSTKRALRTVEGARHKAVVVARGAGLLLLYRSPPPRVAGSAVVCVRNAARRPQDAAVGSYTATHSRRPSSWQLPVSAAAAEEQRAAALTTAVVFQAEQPTSAVLQCAAMARPYPPEVCCLRLPFRERQETVVCSNGMNDAVHKPFFFR